MSTLSIAETRDQIRQRAVLNLDDLEQIKGLIDQLLPWTRYARDGAADKGMRDAMLRECKLLSDLVDRVVGRATVIDKLESGA